MQHLFHSNMNLELIGEVPLFVGLGIQILSALFLGGLVGYDREVKMKAAGLKTNIMICIGATLYTTMSLITLVDQGGVADPNRVAAQIVSGIGFLGAGAIMQSKVSVTGLTTAATMWVVAAIGYTIGIGHIMVATLFSITALVVLRLINPINKLIEKEADYKFFHLEVLASGDCMNMITNFILPEDIELVKTQREELSEKVEVFNLYLKAHPKAIERVAGEIIDSVKVKKLNYFEIHDIESYLKPNLEVA